MFGSSSTTRRASGSVLTVTSSPARVWEFADSTLVVGESCARDRV